MKRTKVVNKYLIEVPIIFTCTAVVFCSAQMVLNVGYKLYYVPIKKASDIKYTLFLILNVCILHYFRTSLT